MHCALCTALQCVLHCTKHCVLHCTKHCTVLHCTTLHCTALHCTTLQRTALYRTVLYYAVLYCTAMYRADSKVSRNPNFCVGCSELIISKNFAAASKMGKNGQKKIFAIFFAEGVGPKMNLFCGFFFAFWDSFCCYCKKPCVPWTLGTPPSRAQPGEPPLWSRFVYVLFTLVWASGPVFPQERPSARGFTPLYQQRTNKLQSQKDWQPNILN